MNQITTRSFTLATMLSPVLLFRGGDTKPERVEPGFKFPYGTLIFSDRLMWSKQAKGKGDKAFPFMTKQDSLLYAILP